MPIPAKLITLWMSNMPVTVERSPMCFLVKKPKLLTLLNAKEFVTPESICFMTFKGSIASYRDDDGAAYLEWFLSFKESDFDKPWYSAFEVETGLVHLGHIGGWATHKQAEEIHALRYNNPINKTHDFFKGSIFANFEGKDGSEDRVEISVSDLWARLETETGLFGALFNSLKNKTIFHLKNQPSLANEATRGDQVLDQFSIKLPESKEDSNPELFYLTLLFLKFYEERQESDNYPHILTPTDFDNELVLSKQLNEAHLDANKRDNINW